MNAKILFTLMLAAGCAWGQSEYVPLQVGNQWIYQTPTGTARAEIVRSELFGGREYFLYRPTFAAEAWLRMADDGTLWQYDPEARKEDVRVAFATPEGGTFETVADPCNRQGIMTTRNGKHTGPVGEFNRVVIVRYPSANCADAGLEREIYAPWIGLVYVGNITIAGPRPYELIYARLGGVTVLSGPEISFSLTLDRAVYTGQPITARITLRHSQPAPLQMTFPSSQTYDLVLKNSQGETVYQWSRGQFFAALVRNETFAPGEYNWVVTVPLQATGGRPLQAGKYTAEVWLTPAGPRSFAAAVGFDVAEAVAPR
ncbi:MAG: BsuPI-related putative proteinase inhibitor [Bryobacteraceae bacterium]